MTTYDIPSGDSEYDIQDSFSKYILAAQDAISVSAGHAIFVDTGNINDQVIIKGQVVASNNDEVAFVSNATGTTLTIAAMGSIRGPDVESVQMNGVGSAVINQGMIEGGVVFSGDNSNVINTGAIVSTTSSALSLSANGITAENAGLLYGGDGIYNFGDHNIVKLDKTSFISAAVGIYDKAGIDLHIVNAGRITASVAIQAHDSVTIVNTGVIEGVINLSSDADRFDDRGGKIDGTVLGGNGDDVLITDKATDILSEKVNQGTDTVKASVTYTLSANVEDLILFGKTDIDGTGNKLDNVITGNSAANTLSGGSGSDTLDGAGGNDTLVGGSGADVFVFETHGGHDVITKFVDGDVLNFSRWDDIQSWHELIHGGHLSEDDGNLIIHAGSDSLTLIGMTEADLTKADVSFHALS